GDVEGLGGLVEQVTDDRHGELLRGDPRREGQGAGGRRVVLAGERGAVVGGEADGGSERGRTGEAHREDRVARAGVALGHRDVIDGERGRRIVVGDRRDALAVADGGVDRVGEVEAEGLVVLVDRVAQDRHRDLLRGGARRERQRSGGGRVVLARDGRAVG